MKLNLVNKLYIGTAIALVLAIFYRFISFKSWARYNYSAVVVAPSTFPVYLKEAYFILPDDELESLDHELVNNFTSNWDTDYSSRNEARSQLLPTKLVLKYVSYRGAKFYRDTLDLPEQRIKTIFKTAAADKKKLELSSYAGVVKGLNFVVGIANDGNIMVWLRGVNLEETLLKVKLKPKMPDNRDTYYRENLSKEAYYKLVFENLSDSVKIRLNNGFDSKANYIDTPSRYMENNKDLWIYQKKNGFID